MRKIMIIEDEIEISSKLESMALEVNPHIEVLKARSRDEVLDLLCFHEIDAFFIDIQLLDYNGLELAKALRLEKKYQFVPMVFITAVPTRELEAFRQVHSYEYILKPFSRMEVLKVFKEILLDYFGEDTDDTYVTLEYKSYNHNLLVKDILFVEIINRRIHIETKDGTIEYIIMPLKKFHDKLPDHFIRIHQSFIINSKYVESYSLTRYRLRLKTYDNELPIGRSYVNEIRGKL